MSCAKIAEPIEMHFGILSWLDPGNIYVLHGNVDASTARGIFGVCGQLKSIVKHRILGLGKKVN